MRRESNDCRRDPRPFHTTNTRAVTSSSTESHSRARCPSFGDALSTPSASPARTDSTRSSSPPLSSPRTSNGQITFVSYPRYDGTPSHPQYQHHRPYQQEDLRSPVAPLRHPRHQHQQHDMARPQEYATANSFAPSAEANPSAWGEGMRSLIPSIIGSSPPKSRVPSIPMHAKAEKPYSDPSAPLPLQAHEVEAATSNWNVPRDTIAMTMGFSGGYEDQSFVQPMWQSQMASGYPSEHGNVSSGFPAPYSQPPAPSGLPGADAPRSRPGTEFPALSESRDYTRRPLPSHSRSATANDYPPTAHNRGMGPADPANSSWWPQGQDHSNQMPDPLSTGMAAPDLRGGQHWPAPVSNGRRVNAPPLPETRSQGRGGWTGLTSSASASSMGFEGAPYEFPQSSLGKRPHEEDPAAGGGNPSDHASDAAYRRYSLAPNMVFSRSPGGAPPVNSMTTYRPAAGGPDPRRPSLGTPAEHSYQLASMLPPPPQSARPYPGSGGGGSWSNWGAAPHPSGATVGASPSPHSSPATYGWKEGVPRHVQDVPVPSPPIAAGLDSSAKRHRRQSSASGGSTAMQTNLLATTPYHVTTDIVLRAPPGSKMEDVYYDQRCEMQTGMPDPPASDFEVENEEDRPRLQTDKLRFPGDLYTPRWVRGTGNAREAWCDRCEHGNWLQLKNSQYWYDQVHKHGISSVSGLRFTAPTHLRVYADAAGTVEGKCHQCKDWVLICTAKRRRNFAAFFKHAHACHSYRKASAVGNGPIVEHNPGHKKKQMMG